MNKVLIMMLFTAMICAEEEGGEIAAEIELEIEIFQRLDDGELQRLHAVKYDEGRIACFPNRPRRAKDGELEQCKELFLAITEALLADQFKTSVEEDAAQYTIALDWDHGDSEFEMTYHVADLDLLPPKVLSRIRGEPADD